MSDYDVREAFGELSKSVHRCIRKGAARNVALGGAVALDLRINPHGEAVSARLMNSTLGDRETEVCILEAALAKTWPGAKGGVGEASHEYVIDSSIEVAQWSSGRLRSVLPEIHRKVGKCIAPVKGVWQMTLYIEKDGHVATSGVSSSKAHERDQADCVVAALNRLRFGPQKQLTKVTFTIP
jgi:hypothetical protein